MKNTLKRTFFHLCKLFGLFYLARKSYKKNPRVLCYHGFTMDDEHLFRAGLFIEPDVFDKRMKYLKDHNYNVVDLHDFYEQKKESNFIDDAVVITIDDGFYSFYKEAAPILGKHNFPSTLYVTSYYFDRNCPIFNLAVAYILYKTNKKTASLAELSVPGLENLIDNDAYLKLLNHSDRLDEEAKFKFLRSLGQILDVDYDDLNNSRILNLITRSEAHDLKKYGVEIQLHTHRHNFPTDFDAATHELNKNKEKLGSLVPTDKLHFCYPSGDWSEDHWEILTKNNILTATTCDPKLVDYKTSNFAIPRILDDARVSQIEFEAEISGFNEFIRKISGK